jgi:hypothetical protein
MTSTATRVALFAVALLAVFGVGVALGGWVDPPGRGNDDAGAHDQMGGAEGMSHMAGSTAAPVRGLGSTENGLRLIVADPQRTASATAPLRFRVVGNGATITDFDELHTKRMHLIVVRRDLTGFQHLHPRMDGDGTWSSPLRLEEPGAYRVFADFSHDGQATTLGGEIQAPGRADFESLPAPAATGRSEGGFDIRLATDHIEAGQAAELSFEIARAGQPAALQTYLGAGGHLVALREGDLAFLHVHPQARGNGEIGFEATFPSAGSYRLFLQFKVNGEVDTAAFTIEVS